jgi:hypothetical protein
VVLPARTRDWAALAPGFEAAVRLASAGVPFQTVAERRYDRSGTPRRLPRALAEGATVFLPQVHQVLPRLARLMVAFRARLFGPGRAECSFLFLVDGTGRPGMGLHHDGEVDALWIQLAGRRTVTVGPPVPPGAPEDLDDGLAAGGRRAGWVTLDLRPGTLFYLPPRTPHAVRCRGRSLALSLTWGARPRRARAGAEGRGAAQADALAAWDVVAGQAERVPPARRDRLWTQAPVQPVAIDRARAELLVAVPGPARARVPAGLLPLVRRLGDMPCLVVPSGRAPARLEPLLALGLLGPRDLPRVVWPDRPDVLDGWRFA